MQGARRKITKKELKEDQLITFYFKARSFLEQHGKAAAIGAGAVALAVVLIVLMINSKIKANLAASYELYQAENLTGSQDTKGAMAKLYQIIDMYPGTENAEEAYLRLAESHYANSNYDSSLYYADKFLKKYSGKDIALACGGYAAKGGALEELKRYKEAAEVYLTAVEKYPKGFAAPLYLIDAGRCYNLAGMDDKAREMYLRAINDYNDSKISIRANEQLARAGGTPVEVPVKMKVF